MPVQRKSLLDSARCINYVRPSSLEQEFSKYQTSIPQSSNPLVFWTGNSHRYPILSKVAAQIMILPASSAASERRFSIAGKVIRPEKASQNEATLKKFAFVNNNKKF